MSTADWKDPKKEPPTRTGHILVWAWSVGPAIVHISETSCHFWDGDDDLEMTDPDEWDWWTEIVPPKNAYTLDRA